MSVIPADITNQLGHAQMLKVERTSVYQSSDIASYTSSSQAVIFSIPPGLLDLRRSYFQMRAVLTNGAASTNSFPYPFQCVFNRLVIRIGATVVFDCYDHGYLQGLFRGQQLTASIPDIDEDGSSVGATRATQSATAQMYQFSMNNEVLQKIIPTNRLGSDANLRIELWIDTIQNWAEIQAGVNFPSAFTIDQCQYWYHLIKETSEVKNYIDSQIRAGNLNIYYIGVESFTQSNLSSTQTTVNLPFHRRCMRGVVVANSPLAAVNDGTTTTPGSKYVNLYPNTNATQAYLKIAGQTYPAQPWDFTVPAGYKIIHHDGRSFFHRWRDAKAKSNDIFVYNVTNQANGLVYCYDFRLDDTNDYLLGSGIDNSSSGANIQVYQSYSAGPGNQMMHAFCFYEAQLNFSPSGVTYLA